MRKRLGNSEKRRGSLSSGKYQSKHIKDDFNISNNYFINHLNISTLKARQQENEKNPSPSRIQKQDDLTINDEPMSQNFLHRLINRHKANQPSKNSHTKGRPLSGDKLFKIKKDSGKHSRKLTEFSLLLQNLHSIKSLICREEDEY